MRAFVAIIAVPLRRFTSDDRSERTEDDTVDDDAEKLRQAKDRAEAGQTTSDKRQPVPDQGVVCAEEGNSYLFATAADTEIHECSNTSVTEVSSGEWIETDATVNVEGWA